MYSYLWVWCVYECHLLKRVFCPIFMSIKLSNRFIISISYAFRYMCYEQYAYFALFHNYTSSNIQTEQWWMIKHIMEKCYPIHLFNGMYIVPDNKVHGANMGPTWVISAPDGPHVGPMNLAIRGGLKILQTLILCSEHKTHFILFQVRKRPYSALRLVISAGNRTNVTSSVANRYEPCGADRGLPMSFRLSTFGNHICKEEGVIIDIHDGIFVNWSFCSGDQYILIHCVPPKYTSREMTEGICFSDYHPHHSHFFFNSY